MSKICDLLREKEYYRFNEHFYRKSDNENGLWDYLFETNELFYSKNIEISAETYHDRCNRQYLPPTAYDYLNIIPRDYLIMYYNHYIGAYIIFAFYALGVNGVAEYAIVKDGKCYDYKNIDDWNNLNVPNEYINAFLDTANNNINYLTGQKCTLKRTNYGDVVYNPKILEKYSVDFKKFADEINELSRYNKSNTYVNNELKKILDAFKKDDYELLMENISDTEYFIGKPLLQVAIENDAKNIFNKLIENREVLNYYDLIWRGCAINYAIIHNSENRMYFVKTLINLGCEINSRDVFGRNILYDAVETYDDELFDYIFNLDGLEIDIIPRGKKLFSSEQNIEYNKEFSLCPILHFACSRGYYHAVISIAPKVDIDASSEDVGTALYYTIGFPNKTEDHYKIIEYLLQNGANLEWYREEEWPRNVVRSIKQLIDNSTDERLLELLNKYKKEDSNE